MVDVEDRVLDAVYYRRIVATWFGEPVWISAAPDEGTGTVTITYERSPEFASATHMGGNQYSSWRALVDARELEDIRVIDQPIKLRELP